jgi:hypothetical protein
VLALRAAALRFCWLPKSREEASRAEAAERRGGSRDARLAALLSF